MTRAPFVMAKPETAFPRGEIRLQDTTIGWRFTNPQLSKLHYPYSMGETAENVAERYHVEREAQDEFALLSHQRAIAAIDEGRLTDEIVPVETSSAKGATTAVSQDEQPRRDTSLERLARLKPVSGRMDP